MPPLSSCIEQVSAKFVYTPDPKPFPFDYWFVMKERNGELKGDCDDFSITILWLLCNSSLLSFIWNVLILHRFKLHRVMALNGYHIVGEVDGLFFDNWTKRALPKEEFYTSTKHVHLQQYWSPVIVLLLISGLFKR